LNKKEAEELSILLLQIGAKLDESVGFVKDKDTEENFLEYRNAIGKVMGYLFYGAKEPLWKRFPELNPEYLDGTYKIDESIFEPKFYQRSNKST